VAVSDWKSGRLSATAGSAPLIDWTSITEMRPLGSRPTRACT
jgi:hypothetical protein